MTGPQSFSLPFDRIMGDSSNSIGGWDRDANGDSGYRRNGGSSPDRLLLMGDSSNDGNRPNPKPLLWLLSKPEERTVSPPRVDEIFGFEGVCTRPGGRVDQTAFLGVKNGRPNLIPREGVDVGSKGDSSNEPL